MVIHQLVSRSANEVVAKCGHKTKVRPGDPAPEYTGSQSAVTCPACLSGANDV